MHRNQNFEIVSGWESDLRLQAFRFLTFFHLSFFSLGQSFRSGYYWKDLFLLHQLTIDGTFGQNWWHQKWKKGQGSLWAVTSGTGVKRLTKLFIRWEYEFDKAVFTFQGLGTEWTNGLESVTSMGDGYLLPKPTRPGKLYSITALLTVQQVLTISQSKLVGMMTE